MLWVATRRERWRSWLRWPCNGSGIITTTTFFRSAAIVDVTMDMIKRFVDICLFRSLRFWQLLNGERQYLCEKFPSYSAFLESNYGYI